MTLCTMARIWNGMDWHYNALALLHYKPALDRARAALQGAKDEKHD